MRIKHWAGLAWLLAALIGVFPPAARAQTQASATAVESSHVFCATPCEIYGGSVNNTNAAFRWLMLFDAIVAPTGGGAAVTGCLTASATRPCVLKWYQVGANSTVGVSDFLMYQAASRIPVATGFVAACSSTGPFTLTYAADCTFSFEVLGR